jgi:uncharacterized protein (TIGR00369 family)
MASLTEIDRNAPRPPYWDVMEATYLESPIHRVLGLDLEVVAAGEAIVRYHGSTCGTNRNGTAAGGLIAELVDSSVVQATRTLLGEGDQVATLELKLNFVRPGPAGHTLVSFGHVEYAGGRTAVGVGYVRDTTDELLALGIVTVSIKRTRIASPAR